MQSRDRTEHDARIIVLAARGFSERHDRDDEGDDELGEHLGGDRKQLVKKDEQELTCNSRLDG
jgi:hypothetical protein